MKTATVVLLNEWADWEPACLTSQLNQNDEWTVVTASNTERPKSLGE